MTEINTSPFGYQPEEKSWLSEKELAAMRERDELEAWAVAYETVADLIRSGTITLDVLKEWEVREQVLSEDLARRSVGAQ